MSSAKQLIKQALDAEETGHVLEAELLYQEGLEQLRKVIRHLQDPVKQKAYLKFLRDYETHARVLHSQVNNHKLSSILVDNINIKENSRGHSFKTLFGQYMNRSVKELVISEPVLTQHHHFKDLISFFEFAVKNCPDLHYVRLFTKLSTQSAKSQMQSLEFIRATLAESKIMFNFEFDVTTREPEIVLSNGYIIKVGLGLHIFKPCDAQYGLGVCDYDYRRCFETDMDVWRSKPFADKN